MKFISKDDIEDKVKDCKLLINASPVGMKEGEDTSVVDKSVLVLNKGIFVYDVVYNRETRLIKDAKLLGSPAVTITSGWGIWSKAEIRGIDSTLNTSKEL